MSQLLPSKMVKSSLAELADLGCIGVIPLLSSRTAEVKVLGLSL